LPAADTLPNPDEVQKTLRGMQEEENERQSQLKQRKGALPEEGPKMTRRAHFARGSSGVFGLNDPTLARGQSGNFYLGVIVLPPAVLAPAPLPFLFRDHADEGKLAKGVGNVHPVTDNEAVGTREPHKLGFDVQLAAAALIEEHGNRNAPRPPV
jgi:hypothetical protein